MMLLLAAALAIQVDVHPTLANRYQLLTRPTPETYTCSVLAIDSEAKKVVAAVNDLTVAPGKSETVKRTGEYSIEFTVTVDPVQRLNAQRAKTHVIVRHGKDVVADQSTIVTLLASKKNPLVPVK